MASASASSVRLCELARTKTTPGVKEAAIVKEVSDLLKEGHNALDRSCYGISSAELAAEHGNLSFLSALFKHIASKKQVLNHDNISILFYLSIKHGHLELAKYLLREGADVNGFVTEKIGSTLVSSSPLMAAMGLPSTSAYEPRKVEILKFLVEKGADIHAKRWPDDKTAAYFATVQDSKAVYDAIFGHSMKGGFSPSVMGAFVTNGARLVPAAAYVGYKMLKNGRSKTRKGSTKARRTRRTR